MTLHELTAKVGGPRPNPKVHLSLGSDGLWTAYYQILEVVRDKKGWYNPPIEQPWFKDKDAGEALKALVMWLRGKTVRERPVGTSAVGGVWVYVPQDLEIPTL